MENTSQMHAENRLDRYEQHCINSNLSWPSITRDEKVAMAIKAQSMPGDFANNLENILHHGF